MEQGTVKWFNVKKGFGFITPVGGGEDVFVRAAALVDGTQPLNEGQNVSFEAEARATGLHARSVRPLG